MAEPGYRVTITGPQPAIRMPMNLEPDPDEAPPSLAPLPRIVRSTTLGPGLKALATQDGKIIHVRASLSKKERKQAILEVIAAAKVSRSPGLVYVLAATYTALHWSSKTPKRGERERRGRHARRY